MSYAKQRTSFALDADTINRLHALSVRWRVSQAEVVRRAVRIAAEGDRDDAESLTRRLEDYWHGGGICAEDAERYLAQAAADRAEWQRGGADDSA